MTAQAQTVKGCSSNTATRLSAFLELARRYVVAADNELRSLSSLRPNERRAGWAGGRNPAASLRHWFGPYSHARLRFVTRVFSESRKRLHEGFDFAGERRPMRIRCLSAIGTRCEKRRLLLANASIFGTILSLIHI